MKKLDKLYNLSKKIVLAPMAGITDGDFCLNYKDTFGIVCLGAFNLDSETDIVSKKIENRGRKEFIYDLNELDEKINSEIEKAKKSNSLVSVNIRFNDFSKAKSPILEISKNADILELNCHCRQPEITDLELGQNLLKNESKLIDFLKNIRKLNLEIPIFLKLRANFLTAEELIELLDKVREYFDGIHIDCFNPGKNYADLEYLKKIRESFPEKIIIGNNSVNSIETAKEMLEYADFASVARCVLSNKIDWIKKL
ncbi:MJ0144 family RNA dihydrouridine synthase-like protein [Methanococcus maripaludis]|uniref:TIM-barrel protein n=2 Tax=Methanococcus maripaludis TaxID=39152 RepID=A0A7J9PHX5_METMI|nr:MJ0144 family RNA dihydrouridine synthase-like protein [Methanococcus maripaludis]MBA2862260.1 TIM-barrel protein [Methanococcus maripaludis]